MKTTTFQNGLRFIHCPSKNKATCSLRIYIDVGSRDEYDITHGLTHMLEHLLFKGTKSFPTPDLILEELEALGADWNAHTTQEEICFMIKVAAQPSYIKRAFQIYAEMVTTPILRNKGVEGFKKEMGTILEELASEEDEPNHILEKFHLTKLFPKDHPLHRSIIGVEKKLKKFELSDARAFWKKHFVPENVVVSVCGGGNVSKNAVRRLFGSWKGRKATKCILRPLSKRKAVRVNCTPITQDQTVICISYHIFDESVKSRHLMRQLLLFSQILNSRLYLDIREHRGLVYAIGSSIRTYKDNLFYEIDTETENPLYKGKRLGTIGCVIRLMRDLVTTSPITKDELKNTFQAFAGGVYLEEEDGMNVAAHYGDAALHNIFGMESIPSLRQELALYRKVTVKDLNKMAKKFFLKDGSNMTLSTASKSVKTKTLRQYMKELNL